MPKKVLFTWSGGKDSALALFKLQSSNDCEVTALLTTVTDGYDRISMHGVKTELLEEQAASLGLPLEKFYISKKSSNEEYEARMRKALEGYKAKGVLSVAFGDLFLPDVREYREKNLARLGMKAIFPLWKENTEKLASRFMALGFKAITTCVDSNVLGKDFVGRPFDKQFLSDLLPEVDPCGENGEFHSFVFDGPNFKKRVNFEKGKVVLREKRFYYCDLEPR